MGAQVVLGPQLREQAGDAPRGGRVAADDAQVEVQQRAVLQLQRALELLGLDDGVDAQLARVAVIGVLQRALALLEHPSRAAIDEPRCRCEDQLDRGLVVV
jgi:hypothetical protein